MAAIIGWFAFIFLVTPHQIAAQINERRIDRMLRADPQQPWELEADQVIYDRLTDQYIAIGNVQITKADINLSADFIRFDQTTMKAYAWGNVILIVAEDVLSGSRLEIDLENQVGTIDNAYLFLAENNYHIQARTIKKVGEDRYEIDAATMTTCDGDPPDWKITGRDIKIKDTGSGSTKHATLYARNMPVLYSPYFYYPARSERQTGFLIPEWGQSERKGEEYNQPFFWAISDSSDATFYAHYMSQRGLKLGSEYRYFLSERTKGAIMLDGFRDEKIDDGTGNTSDNYGFNDNPVDVTRTNESRFWFRASHHQELPYEFYAKLDLDIISDQDYLREFRTGFMGYQDTDDYFRKFFHRQLDDFNDPVRLNRLNLNRIWPKYSLNAEPRWFDNVIQRREGGDNDTLQRLPLIGFDGAKQKILTSPFYFDLESSYNYFWRQDGPRGQRIDAAPRFYLPLRVKNYFTFEPSVGGRGTVWRLDKSKFDEGSDNDQWFHRELFDTRMDLFSDITKVFNLEGSTIEKIKHTIRSQITHEYIPDVDQNDLPDFDPIDRIKETNRITYSITNTLTSKSQTQGSLGAKSRQRNPWGNFDQQGADFTYTDFLRLKVEQTYDFEKERRPFLPILAQLNIIPGKYIWVDADSRFSVYDTEFLSHNVEAKLSDTRRDSLRVDYVYAKKSEETNTAESTHSIYGKLSLKLIDPISVFVDHEQDIEDDLRIRSRLGFTYQAQCWAFNFIYTNQPNDQSIAFRIKLFGLGETGY